MIDESTTYLLRWEAANRSEREAQEWAHDHIFRSDEARRIHDWHACPKCSRIDSGTLRGDNIPKSCMTPAARAINKSITDRRVEGERRRSRAKHQRKKAAKRA